MNSSFISFIFVGCEICRGRTGKKPGVYSGYGSSTVAKVGRSCEGNTYEFQVINYSVKRTFALLRKEMPPFPLRTVHGPLETLSKNSTKLWKSSQLCKISATFTVVRPLNLVSCTAGKSLSWTRTPIRARFLDNIAVSWMYLLVAMGISRNSYATQNIRLTMQVFGRKFLRSSLWWSHRHHISEIA